MLDREQSLTGARRKPRRERVGFARPQQDDGIRIEPAPSLALAAGTMRAATAAAEPPLDPSATRPRSHGVAGAEQGRFFGDRYHARVLRSPLEVKRALAYVLNNARRHAAQRGARMARGWLDPYSSARAFTGWRGVMAHPGTDEPWLAPPRTSGRRGS